MQCSYCGQENVNGAQVCAYCGQPLSTGPDLNKPAPPGQPPYQYGGPSYPPAGMPPPGTIRPIRDYMSWSIVTLVVSVLTCNVLSAGLAIPAIVFSSQARDQDAMGDSYGAHSSRKTAQIFFWIAFGLCAVVVVFWLLYLGFILLAFLGMGLSTTWGY